MKIKVLHIVPNMNVGGLETFIMNIYRNIDCKKFQFDFLEHYKEESVYDSEIKKLGGTIYHLSFRNDNNIFKYIKDLNNFFKVHKEYKIIHCHMSSVTAIVFLIAKKYGIKVRISHSHNTMTEKTFKGFLKRICASFGKYTSTINLACSKEAGEYLFGIKKFEIIPNAIELEKFEFNDEKRKALRKKLGIDSKYVIGHVGRFSLQKNHQFLINLFYKYQLINPNTVLVLIGIGESMNKIKKQVSKLKIENKVIFLGLRQDINELYSMFDLFVFPSFFEGLGMVLIEAQINGLPCLVSDTIPKVTKISNKIKYLSLKDSGLWINEIKKHEKNILHQVSYNNLKDIYNIKVIVKKMEKIYSDNL